MQKIATPRELQNELRRVMSQVTEGCSRAAIASTLGGLADRIAADGAESPPEDALADLQKAVSDLQKAAKGDRTGHNIYECLGWVALGVRKLSRDHVAAATVIDHAAEEFRQALKKIKPKG